MKRVRGSFTDKERSVIVLRDIVVPSDGGSIKISSPWLEPPDPQPNSWIMLKPGDLLISHSGTIRYLLKKNWDIGKAEFLKLKCDNHGQKIGAILDIEKLEINTSNFENLLFVLRAGNHKKHHFEYSSDHFPKSIRFNILTLLGFGDIGSRIHILLTELIGRQSIECISLQIKCDIKSGQFKDIITPSLEVQDSTELEYDKKDLVIEICWERDLKSDTFRIPEFLYPGGTPVLNIETIQLSCEMANILSLANAITMNRTFR